MATKEWSDGLYAQRQLAFVTERKQAAEALAQVFRDNNLRAAAAGELAVYTLAQLEMPPGLAVEGERWGLPFTLDFIWIAAFSAGWRAAADAASLKESQKHE